MKKRIGKRKIVRRMKSLRKSKTKNRVRVLTEKGNPTKYVSGRNIQDLPLELMVSILSFLPVYDIFMKLKFVSKDFHKCIHNRKILFRLIYEREFGKMDLLNSSSGFDIERELFQKCVLGRHKEKFLTFRGRRGVDGSYYIITLRKMPQGKNVSRARRKRRGESNLGDWKTQLEGVLCSKKSKQEFMKIPYETHLEPVIKSLKLEVKKLTKSVDCVILSSKRFSFRNKNVISFKKKRIDKFHCPHLSFRKGESYGHGWDCAMANEVHCKTCGVLMKRKIKRRYHTKIVVGSKPKGSRRILKKKKQHF